MHRREDYSVCRVSVTFLAETTAQKIVDDLENNWPIMVTSAQTVTIRETRVVKFSAVPERKLIDSALERL